MIRIALPSKGRLAESARELLARAGLEPEFRGERALQAALGDGVVALFVRAADIPEFVAEGAADLGITGRDLVEEIGRPEIRTRLDLGFGRCRLVVAVRDESGIDGALDFAPGLRVATAFPRLTERYFRARGQDVTLVPVSGSTEITPLLGVADAVVDLVATGSTLRMNGLREVATVLESTAVLIAGPALAADAAKARRAGDFATVLESVLRAQEKRYLMANVPRRALAEVRRTLPGLNGPTIVDVLDGADFVATHAVVDRREVDRVIAELKGFGAEGILVTRIERLMP
jgi:ATP phosphoribosyltransferase